MKLLRTTALTAALITAAVPILTSSAEAWRGGGWRGAGIGWCGGGWRGAGIGWRARRFVILRVRLRLPRLRLWLRHRLPGLRLWLWDRLQLPLLWLRHDQLYLPDLRLWHRLQLPRLWLWQGHCPPRSLCRRRWASLALKGQTKASRRILAEERLL